VSNEEGPGERDNDIPHLDREDLILTRVIPYVQDPFYIAKLLEKARISGDPVRYLERISAEAGPERRGDIRILLNAVTRRTANVHVH